MNDTCSGNNTNNMKKFCEEKLYSYLIETCFRLMNIDPINHKTK